MKYCFVFMGLFLIPGIAGAQLIDTLAAGSVGSVSATQGVKSVRQGLSMMQQNQVVQNINKMVMDIKMNSLNGYQGLNKDTFQGSNPFGGLGWDVGSVSNSQFYLELTGVDAATCRRLMDLVQEYASVSLNGSTQKSEVCSDNSKIKWVFD